MSRFIIGILLLLFNIWLPVYADNTKKYTVGIVPQFDARKIRKIWLPILRQVEADTGYKFVLRGSPTIPRFEREFNNGEFDFAYMNPYHVLLANKSQGYIPLVRDVGRTLHGVLVVKKDSPIKGLQDLDGKKVAFPAPNALGASLLIRADLQDIYKVQIEPLYVKTHSSVYLNVILGTTAAGGGVQKTLNQQSPDLKSNLRVMYKTREVNPHPFSVHPRVPEPVRKAVQNALLKMGQTAEGKKLLSKIPVKNIGVSTMEDYQSLGGMGLERYYLKN